MSHLKLCVAVLCLVLATPCLAAVNIKYIGSAPITDYRTVSVSKTLDPDHDNVFGTAGYVFYGTDAAGNANAGNVAVSDPLTFSAGTMQTKISLPPWLTLMNNGQSRTATSYPSYPLIDDPSLSPATTVADVQLGLAVRLPNSLGVEGSMVDLQIGEGVPLGGVRVGIVCFASTGDAIDVIRLAIGSTVSASAGRENIASVVIYLFDIVGAQAGDVATLFLTKNVSTGGNANLAYIGLTFDAIPSSVPPVVVARVPSAGPVARLPQVTVNFSKPVQGVKASDLLINNIAATNVSGALSSYTFRFPQPAYGPVLVSWADAQGITDTLVPPTPFNGTGPGSTWQYQLVGPPAFTAMRVTNGNVTLSWESYPGMRYQLQSATNLPASAWTALGSEIVATNSTSTFSGAAAGECQFYRVLLLDE